ncbi:fork head transcription factor 1 [Agrilus planipennis]|uniref:Fork head transcription factor 1 n=1 Tax=Agrilus planipennis TaxID=224129 RepID=A0A1W4WAZ0_AGRPL|nr:fork head transcription factor 1 [Agrilus planipennis]XP_018321175.1 fork head transcription factor 1 [Agrilus planipennis]XP_018321176.1 fork head transcription factor 1 [Agrilus planipennis]
MSAAMDMYLTGTDSISLQEMLDIDIKSEIDVLVGGHNDLPPFNFSELPPLELEEAGDIRWISSSNSNHSNSSFTLDFSGDYASTMVNPNAVMPFTSTISLAQNIRSPSPTLKESHLTFSPSVIKIGNIKADTSTVKKDLLGKLNNMDMKKRVDPEPIIKIACVPSKQIEKPTTVRTNNTSSILTFRNTMPSVVSISQVHNTIKAVTTNRKQTIVNTNSNDRFFSGDRTYPKPAYSYSCLIAMALKNSRTGSLPVSEIYNFMCRHFPYFKTAPNGWKNSVRHNLSLNKCFEKIEKPAINGSQRKGCLWAMNPTKISKMDEEMQKWSKKDPSAIRRAMTHPENMEALERGELKFTYKEADNYDNFGDSCGSAESEEGSDTEPENELENNIETEFIEVKSESDYEVETADVVFEEDDEEILQMEMVLAQKELFQYDRNSNNNKRRRMYIIQK